ncbi:hypothetical protein P3S68_021929 [Capsicum galapagoense]
MVRKRRFNGEIKSCGIHDLLREFCLNEAEMTNFMHVKSTNPTLPTPKHNVCRFNFQTQTHLVEDCCKQLPPTARSIYLFCDYIFSKRWSSVKLEVFSRFNLLRVLAIFHEDVSPPPFPLAITKLFHLTYLSIRCRGKLPASMAVLQNLQTLVMDGFNIILPGKIWMTKKLRHIHVGGYYSFPSRRRETIRNIHLPIDLPNLVELSRPYYSNCTNEVFSAIPNLKRLNVYVSCMRKKDRLDNHLIDMSSLRKLEALKCFSNGMYQHFYWQPLSMKRFVFPLSLKRLSFSKCRFPWEDISTLAMLPNLEELKLKYNAVLGEVWRLSDDDKFESLKLLLFSNIYLERWEVCSDSFPNLKSLVLKRCECLREIPTDFGEICTLEAIELDECSRAAEDSVKKIEQEQDMGNNFLKVYIRSSGSYW